MKAHDWSRVMVLTLILGSGLGWAAAPDPEVARLEARPDADRRTTAYHLALAEAHLKAAQPGPGADALHVASILSPTASSERDRLQVELGTRAAQVWRKVEATLESDPTEAAKGWLLAVKCDSSWLARPDRGLRARGVQILRDAMAAKPGRLDLGFQLAYYLYLTGDRAAALAAFQDHAARDTDTYRSWRSLTWAAHLQRESNDEDARRQAFAPAAVVPSGHSEASAPNPGVRPRLSTAPSESAVVADLESKLASLDGKIKYLTSPGRRHVVEVEGKSHWVSVNDSRLVRKVDELKAERAEVERQRNLELARSHGTSRGTDPVQKITDRLGEIASERARLSRGGWTSITQGQNVRWVGAKDSRVLARLEELATEQSKLEDERATLTGVITLRSSSSSRDEGDRPAVPVTSGEGVPLPAEAPTQEPPRRQELDGQISQVDYEIRSMMNTDSERHRIVDEQGKTRWVKVTDSRYQPYLDGLNEKKQKLQRERDTLR